MGEKPSPFGMDEEIIFRHKEHFMSVPHIKIIGIHVYNGTRILNVETIKENIDYILNLARLIQEEWKITLEMVDISGGLGIPYYFDGERELDLVLLKAEITSTIESYLSEFLKIRIILESGRYLVVKSGILVSRVIDIKLSKGEWFVVTDGGTHCHMAAVGMESFIKCNFPISVIALKLYPSQIFRNIILPDHYARLMI